MINPPTCPQQKRRGRQVTLRCESLVRFSCLNWRWGHAVAPLHWISTSTKQKCGRHKGSRLASILPVDPMFWWQTVWRFCCRTKWRVRGPSSGSLLRKPGTLPQIVFYGKWTELKIFQSWAFSWVPEKLREQEKCTKNRMEKNLPLQSFLWTPEPGWLRCHWFPCRGTLDISTCFTRSRRKRISRMRRKWRMRRLGTCRYSLDFFTVMECSLLQLLVVSWSVRLVASDAYHSHGNGNAICKLIKEPFAVVGLSW